MIYDICIIGAGASGMVAAITAMKTNPKLKIAILEKNKEPGRKILATGNGRCNLSNVNAETHEESLKFFEEIGLVTKVDEMGRIYPYTEDAQDVRNILLQRALKLGIKFYLSTQVSYVNFDNDTFVCGYESGKSAKISQRIRSKKLLIACGGKASPVHGTIGDGYKMAKQFGHSVTKLMPALTAVETVEDFHDVSGIRAKAALSLKFVDETVAESSGEIQFTDYGISGICVFDLSRFMVIPEGKNLKNGLEDYTIEVDFLPGAELAELKERLAERRENIGTSADEVMLSIVRRKLAERIYRISKGNTDAIAENLKSFVIHPKSLRGWEHAQITKGGVELSEINMDTMESLIRPRLYFAGEVTDFDGACGGFNLEYAWHSGMLAGKNMAENI